MPDTPEVLIIGAGLAGLCCGRRLAQCGVSFRILEAADGVGGRVRTDLVEGFRLDRGFQLYLPSYPEGRRVLDYPPLRLMPFTRGAMVRFRGRFHRVADPRAEFITAARSLFNPVGSFRDKLRLAKLKWLVDRERPDRAPATDVMTLEFLRWNGGLTPKMIDRLFRPFFGGVFLDRDLATSSRLFRFLFQQFAAGPGAVPALGMQAIPEQIAAGLPSGTVRLGATVAGIDAGIVRLKSGDALPARAIVIAVEGPEAVRLTGGEIVDPGSNGSTTLYYAARKAPVREPILMLDGDGTGPVNSVAVMSNVSPDYAPAGGMLMSAAIIGISLLDDMTLDRMVRMQLAEWFGDEVRSWRLLRVYRIRHALPDQTAGKLDPWQRPVRLQPGRYVCGDHRDQGSIDGAMTSGFRAAQAVMEDLSAKRV